MEAYIISNKDLAGEYLEMKSVDGYNKDSKYFTGSNALKYGLSFENILSDAGILMIL